MKYRAIPKVKRFLRTAKEMVKGKSKSIPSSSTKSHSATQEPQLTQSDDAHELSSSASYIFHSLVTCEEGDPADSFLVTSNLERIQDGDPHESLPSSLFYSLVTCEEGDPEDAFSPSVMLSTPPARVERAPGLEQRRYGARDASVEKWLINIIETEQLAGEDEVWEYAPEEVYDVSWAILFERKKRRKSVKSRVFEKLHSAIPKRT